MQQLIKESKKVREDIIENHRNITELNARQSQLENRISNSNDELKKLKADLTKTEINQFQLTTRNEVVREKFSDIDENVKEGADLTKDVRKAFFKKLGLKLSVACLPSFENLLELKIMFEENDYQATFVYDSITEDYDRKNTNFL